MGHLRSPARAPCLSLILKNKEVFGRNFVSSLTSLQGEIRLSATFQEPLYARISLVVCYQGITCLLSRQVPSLVSSCRSPSPWVEATWDKLTPVVSLLPEMYWIMLVVSQRAVERE